MTRDGALVRSTAILARIRQAEHKLRKAEHKLLKAEHKLRKAEHKLRKADHKIRKAKHEHDEAEHTTGGVLRPMAVSPVGGDAVQGHATEPFFPTHTPTKRR